MITGYRSHTDGVTPRDRQREERRARYRAGHLAEWLAAFALMLQGYRILARRFKTRAGEIDLIAVRGGTVAFIEVKKRATEDEAHDAITAAQARRIRHAAGLWIGKRRRYQGLEQRFDAVFVLPGRWPLHVIAGA
jgi:putative endonuclease